MPQNTLPAALGLTTLAGLATGLGGLLALWFTPGEGFLAAALGFAAGAMLAASLADLAPAGLAFWQSVLPAGPGALAAVLLVALGMLLAAAMQRFLPGQQTLLLRLAVPGPAAAGQKAAAALRCALAAGAALVLHNLPEGMLTLFSGAADLRAGLRLSLAIALHNIPEGVSVAAPLWYATRSRALAAGAAFASGLAEPLGALAAWALLARWLGPGLLAALELAAAGIMCQVAVAELLFAAFAMGGRPAASAGFAAGACGMLASLAALG